MTLHLSDKNSSKKMQELFEKLCIEYKLTELNSDPNVFTIRMTINK